MESNSHLHRLHSLFFSPYLLSSLIHTFFVLLLILIETQYLCANETYFKVKPKRGRIVLFYSMKERNNYNNLRQSALNQFSLHMGCPVGKGKIIIS
jgi:hypothetical protein